MKTNISIPEMVDQIINNIVTDSWSKNKKVWLFFRVLTNTLTTNVYNLPQVWLGFI